MLEIVNASVDDRGEYQCVAFLPTNVSGIYQNVSSRAVEPEWPLILAPADDPQLSSHQYFEVGILAVSLTLVLVIMTLVVVYLTVYKIKYRLPSPAPSPHPSEHDPDHDSEPDPDPDPDSDPESNPEERRPLLGVCILLYVTVEVPWHKIETQVDGLITNGM